jgi:hypothetical protein
MTYKSLKLLRTIFPDGKIPDGYQPPEKALALIPGFVDRYESLKGIFDCDYVDHEKVEKFRELAKLADDFFWAWETSSRAVTLALGETRAIEILELFSIQRSLTWEFDAFMFFERCPDHIEIFRGGEGKLDDLLLGFSWSLSKDVAERFANMSSDGILIRAEIAKNDVLLVATLEYEVVPRLGSLSNIVQLDR